MASLLNVNQCQSSCSDKENAAFILIKDLLKSILLKRLTTNKLQIQASQSKVKAHLVPVDFTL